MAFKLAGGWKSKVFEQEEESTEDMSGYESK